jgi:hypothetical protein
MMNRKKIAVVVLSALLLVSCNASQVQAYINLAIGIALQVAKLAGLSPTSADRVSADLAVANKLIADYRHADATSKPGKLAEIDTALNVAENDLSDLLSAARVSDPKLQSAIRASISIAITAVESIRALENAKPSSPVAVAAKAAIAVMPGSGALPANRDRLAPEKLKELYNLAVSDYPQAQLH